MSAPTDSLAHVGRFLLQAPPGEINDCLADCRTLIANDELLEGGILPALARYNIEQLTVANVPGHQHQMVICQAGQLTDRAERFVDPRSRQSFHFDHMRTTASDPQPLPIDETVEPLRKALETAALAYVEEHLHQGVGAVFAPLPPAPTEELPEPLAPEPTEPEAMAMAMATAVALGTGTTTAPVHPVEPRSDPVPGDGAVETVDGAGLPPLEDVATADPADPADGQPPDSLEPKPSTLASELDPPSAEGVPAEPPEPLLKRYQVALVGNKYNPNNFWTGRWRALYDVDLEAGQVAGVVHVNVHYYEQGNVQLSTSKEISFAVDATGEPAASARAVLTGIGKAEREVQVAINEAHVDMNDKTLKELRRALPMTKSKLDWNRIASFRTAKELRRAEA